MQTQTETETETETLNRRPLVRLALFGVPILTLAACGLADPAEPGNLVARTVAEDPSLPAIDLAGTRFHAETFGDPADPPIIFLHGGPGGDYRGLLRLRPLLQDDYFLVFWDQRGAGLSQRHDADDIDTDVYIADLDAIIDRYAPSAPPVIVGHSWGGMFATAYINAHPDRVAAAVMLEPGPLTGALFEEKKSEIVSIDVFAEWANDFLWQQRFLTSDEHAQLDYAPLIAKDHAQPAYHQSETDPEPSWRFGTVAQNALYADGMPDGIGTWDFTTNMMTYPGTVHLVASELNTVIGVEFQERQSAFFAHPTLSVVEGAGHDFPWTHPDATAALIRQTLDQIAYGK
jgi:proline iminopeptidase